MINKLIKNIIFAFICLYGINLLFESFKILIPINPITLIISTFLGLPGILSLIIINIII